MNRRAVFMLLWPLVLLALLSAGRRPVAAGQTDGQPCVPFAPTLLWQRCPNDPHYFETGWHASPAVADLNHDGQPEAIWGGYTQ
jgi:hypothetical protein